MVSASQSRCRWFAYRSPPLRRTLLAQRGIFQPPNVLTAVVTGAPTSFATMAAALLRVFLKLIDFFADEHAERADGLRILLSKSFTHNVVVINQVAIFLQIFGCEHLMPARSLQFLSKRRLDAARVDITAFPGCDHFRRTQRQ